MILRVIDVETDGLPPDARVVEIATVDLLRGQDSNVWMRGEMWSSLVNNERPIPPELSAVHHITTAMVKNAPRIHEVLPLCLAMRVDYLVSHNARFEKDVLASQGITVPWLCTYKAALALWPEAPSHGNQALRYWLNLNFVEDVGPPHRALGDAYVTAALARSILARLSIEEWTDISSRPALLPRFRFGKHQGVPIPDVPFDYLQWVVDNVKDDEDVQWTARQELARRIEARRARSPV